MAIIDEALPGWVLNVAEVSAGVYSVTATDLAGRVVEKKGLDPDSLIAECKRSVIEMLNCETEASSR